jgi:hypothetical protein
MLSALRASSLGKNEVTMYHHHCIWVIILLFAFSSEHIVQWSVVISSRTVTLRSVNADTPGLLCVGLHSIGGLGGPLIDVLRTYIRNT